MWKVDLADITESLKLFFSKSTLSIRLFQVAEQLDASKDCTLTCLCPVFASPLTIQDATTPSRKRKLNQEGLSQLDPLSSISVEKEALSSTISSDAFTLEEKEKVSHLEYLGPAATITALSISRALGGEGWKNQSIGKLGSIQTKSRNSLHALLGAVETSLKLVQLPKAKPGSFNSDLVEALNRAYHDRINTSNKVNGAVFTNGLERSDYERATELLKGKIEEDGE